MRKTLLFTACIIILTMGLVFVSCKKKEETAKQEEPAAANEQELVQEAEEVLSETEELEQAVEQGTVSGNEAVQNLDTLKQKEAELKKKAEELGTTALIILMDKMNKKLNKVARSVEMEELPEEDKGKQ